MTTFLSPGTPAPTFSLPDQNNKIHDLTSYRGKWVILYFYPKDLTPGCTKEACQFRDSHPDFESENAIIFGISKDTIEKHKKFIEKQDLNFDLLSDNADICEQYGTWVQKSMFGNKYMGIARSTYLIDPNGNIAFVWEKVKIAGHDRQVLKKIQELS